MGAFGVVPVAECVELLLQFRDGFCGGLCADPFFEGLVEAFYFSLGLWVSGSTIFLFDAVVFKEFFEGGFSSFGAG